MKKIVVQDIFITLIWLVVFVLLLSILYSEPSYNYPYSRYWYYKGLVFGIYAIFMFFACLKEQIKYIALADNNIIIQYSKFLKKYIIKIDKNDLKCCTMYIYRNYIKLNFTMENNKTLVVNHRFVTPVFVEKISKISDFVDKFDYVICNTDFPKSSSIIEKIIHKDKKVILQQKIYSCIMITGFIIMVVIIAVCALCPV